MLVLKITENEDRWVDVMMKHELEMIEEKKASSLIGLEHIRQLYNVRSGFRWLTYVYAMAWEVEMDRFPDLIALDGIGLCSYWLDEELCHQNQSRSRCVGNIGIGCTGSLAGLFCR